MIRQKVKKTAATEQNKKKKKKKKMMFLTINFGNTSELKVTSATKQ